jgi:hypothetical protein
MRKSHFNKQFLVLLGPTISSFFACSNEEKSKPKQQSVHALVQSLCPYLVIASMTRKESYITLTTGQQTQTGAGNESQVGP